MEPSIMPGVSCTFQMTSHFFGTLFTCFSMYTIVATALERMINTTRLPHTRQDVPIKRANYICIICLILAVLSVLSKASLTIYRILDSTDDVLHIMLAIAVILVSVAYMILYKLSWMGDNTGDRPLIRPLIHNC